MTKIEVKKFVGKPVLSQILDVIPSSLIQQSGREHQSNRYYNRLTFRVNLVSLLDGVFNYCNGVRELCVGLLACEGMLSYRGFDKAPARSTLADANNNRHYRVIESVCYGLLSTYHSYISNSQLKGLSIRNLKVIDRSTIQLFSEILRGVCRSKQIGRSKKKRVALECMR